MNRRSFFALLLAAPSAYATLTVPSFPIPKYPRRVRIYVTAQGQTFVVLDSVIRNLLDENGRFGDKVKVEGL